MKVLAALALVATSVLASAGPTRAAVSPPPTFVSLASPSRLLDTRPGAATVDGGFAGDGARPADSVLELAVTGRVGIPADVGAVALNITATEPVGPGFVTVYACGQERPTSSSLNYAAKQTVPNLVVSRVGPSGTVCLYTKVGVHLIVDVSGYFPSSTGLQMLAAPARMLDTRTGASTFDGANAGTGLVASGGIIRLRVAGRAGIAPAALTVLLNVTVTDPILGGFITVYSCDGALPVASNLNYVARSTVANAVISRVDPSGEVCLYASAAAHLVVDAIGFTETADALTTLPVPTRLLDTRPGQQTVDGTGAGLGERPSGGTVQVQVAGRGGVPSNATVVFLNVTATEAWGAGFVTAYPTGSAQPVASNVNYVSGQTVPNAVVARVGSAGSVCLYTHVATHLIVDVAAYIVDGSPAATGGACPGDPLPPPAPTPPVAVVPAPGPVIRGPGQYVVGQGIPPGRYSASGAVQGCYWERESGFGGTVAEVLANDFRSFSGPVIVDVLATDVGFKFSGACGQMREYSPPATPVSAFGPGTYAVGADIVPGTYAATVTSGCYWERTNAFTGEISSIIANDFVSTGGPVFVSIGANDVGFTATRDCGTWARV